MVDGTLKPFLAPNLNGETLEVHDLCSDRQNGLWVGTTHGLYRIRGTEVDHYDAADGLSSDWVRRILEDREGNVWVATSRGIDMFRDLRVKSISQREGLNDGEVESVAASQDGNVWIGTGRLQILGPRGVSLFGPGKRLPGNLVTSLFTDHAGRLWAGMINRLFVYERGSFREVTKQDGSALGMVMGIAEDSDHTVWVESAGQTGTLLRIQDLKVRQQFPAPAMPLARKIVADPQGGIWLGLVTGDLARYRDGQVNTFTFGDHPNSRVLALAAASDGSILGGTEFGVVGWKNGKQQILTVQNGLPCNAVNALISDDAGNLWLNAGCGLIEISKQQMQVWWENPESKLSLRVFDILDGVQPGFAPFNSSAKTPDGRLWFANGSVVQVIDPAHIPENILPPPVDISALVADRKAYALESAIHLPPQTRELEIDYTALSYVAPQKVLFHYMLEGHDPGWQEPGTRRQAFYNDLRPGRYRFRVIACNNDGVWNEAGASLNFSILPAYYQTAWFRVACGAAFLGLLWAIYQLRVQQLRRRFNIGVEARVNERTRIAQELHDTLLQGFISASMQLGVADRQLPVDWPAKPIVTDVLKLMRDVIEEGRKAVRGMRLSGGDSDDLERAFSRISQELVVQRAVGFRVLVEGQVRPLHPLIRDEVYRIGREALVNAFHHSEAASVEVELEYADRELRVLVRDNGCGIDPQVLQSGREGHWGLSGMRERAGRIGARLKVWSDAAAGTEVELSVPGRVAYRLDASARGLDWFGGFGRRKGGDHAQKPGNELETDERR
jgi:signal transduction histidine kinase